MNEPAVAADTCFHCGLEADPAFTADVNGVSRLFCCIGCQCVAQTIAAGGLSDFYRYRDAQNKKAEQNSERFDAYDLESVYGQFVVNEPGGQRRVNLHIGGISCAACAWLIEHWLEQLEGVDTPRVNVATHQCSFRWDSGRIKLSAVFSALHNIGYRPQPRNEAEQQAQRKKEQRTALLRIGVAGLGMMQVGMVGVGLHAGDIQGIDASWQHFLRWVSLVFALPVVLFSAQPFFISAWRSLKLAHLNMDVPVSLALILAFSASVLATVTNEGQVYFDSVSMFAFFLLLGRYIEMRARHTSQAETERYSRLLPHAVERVRNSQANETELVPIENIAVGDEIYVAAGEVIPFDGTLISEQRVSVDESLLTGESRPLIKQTGDALIAGSVLAEPALTMSVSALAKDSRLAAVQALYDDAMTSKPDRQQRSDAVARYFVAAVLVICVAVFAFWSMVDASKAFWVTLSVLVVTCPCALSLASPTAQAAGLNGLRRMGFLVMAPHALETLPSIQHVVFDKTGTLTHGELRLMSVKPIADFEHDPLAVAVALERGSKHPVARALCKQGHSSLKVVGAEFILGKGVQGEIGGVHYRFGRAEFATHEPVNYPGSGMWQLLSCDGRPLAWFLFDDAPRPQLNETWKTLQQRPLRLSIFSGDRSVNIAQFVDSYLDGCRLAAAKGDMLPENKMSALRDLQAAGEKVMMVGDGINDVPVLGAADVSVALGSATQLAKVSADTVLLHGDLDTLPRILNKATAIARCVRQNYMWALTYNALALPAAAAGLIPPYLAALGMSLSSLIVVLNSARLSKV